MHNTGVPQLLAGRFRIESVLGSGGMGAVYAATDTSVGRRVAIKMLHPDVALQRDSLERMREEAFSLASLHHPNIVQLFDFYAGGPECTFLVMELVEAGTLNTVLRTRVPFPVETAIDYAKQVLSALAAAHARGIFHRDIKPANLLVVSLPARHELIKVIDFGIAKLTEETIRRRPTTAGVLLGTPTFMASDARAWTSPVNAAFRWRRSTCSLGLRGNPAKASPMSSSSSMGHNDAPTILGKAPFCRCVHTTRLSARDSRVCYTR